SPGDDRSEKAGLSQHHHPQAVLDVVPLQFDAGPCVVAENDAAIGEHAIHVKTDELDAPGEGAVERGRGTENHRVHRRARVQISTHCSMSASSWSSGIIFGPSLGAVSGVGCVSRNNPSAPAAQAAFAST